MQDFDVIETPENVALERRLAGIGSRFMAGLIDTIIVFLIDMAIVILFWVTLLHGLLNLSFWDYGGASWWMLALAIAAWFALYWGYFVFFELRTNGQSPGKKKLCVRVMKEDGSPIRFTDIAIRNLMRAVDGLGFYAVAGVCMFLTKRAQRLGDLAAATLVVSEQTLDYSAQSDKRTSMKWESEISADELRATGLTPEEYRVLHNYWLRRNDLTFEARQRVLPALLGPILKRTRQTLRDESLWTLEKYLDDLFTSAAACRFSERRQEPKDTP